MKIKSIILSLFLLVFVLTVLTGCFHKDNFFITNYVTGKVVASFSLEENEKQALMLTNALNYCENKEVKLNSKPKYMVHFVDPKDSLHDLYFYVYIENDNVYVQFNMDKMQGLEDTFHVGLDGSIKKTNGITVDEFNSILTKFKVD